MSLTRALARVAFLRLARARRGWMPIALYAALALAGGAVAHANGDPTGADHTMRRIVGFLVLPLLTYGIASATFGGDGLRPSLRGVVALGASPARAAFASVAVAIGASVVVAGAIALVTCAVAHGAADPPLAQDLPASFGVTALGAAAYAAYWSAGSAIGRGAMRGVFLVVDLVVGAPNGFGALFTPRGHVTSLLGGAPCFEISRPASSVALVVLLLLYVGFALRLGRRVR